MREITFYRCDHCDEVFGILSTAFARDPSVVAIKTPRREYATQSAFPALRHVIDTTKGTRHAPKRKLH
jgi:hypothetical protein